MDMSAGLTPAPGSWRLTITLDGADTATLTALLEDVGGELSDPDGSGLNATVHVYAAERQAALDSEEAACRLLDDTEAGYETQLDQWDATHETWVADAAGPGGGGEEWCLTAELDGDETEIAALVSLAAAELTFADRVTRAGRLLRVYTGSEPDAARAEEAFLALVDATALGYEVWQERWDAELGEWDELAPDTGPEVVALAAGGDEAGEEAEDADMAVWEHTAPELDPASIAGMGERRRGCWVVKVELGDAAVAASLHDVLRARGLVVGRVGSKVGMLVADSATAGYVASVLLEQPPVGAGTVTTAEASRVERVAYGTA